MSTWRVVLKTDQNPHGIPVRIDADPGASAADLVRGSQAVIGAVDGELFLDGTAVDEHLKVEDIGLLDGRTLSIGTPDPPMGDPGGLSWELRTIGGLAAGWYARVGPGAVIVGSGARADFLVADPSVADAHCRVGVIDGVASVEPLDGAQVVVDGVPISSRTTLTTESSVVRIGSTLLGLCHATRADASTTVGDGIITLYRGPRSGYDDLPGEVEFPDAPQRAEDVGVMTEMTAGIGSAAMGMIMGVASGNPLYLGMALFGPILAFVTAKGRRRTAARKFSKGRDAYEKSFREAAERLAAARLTEAGQLRDVSPNPAEVSRRCAGPTARLWERRPTDPDALEVRIGSGAALSTVPTKGLDPDGKRLWMVPINGNLRAAGGLAIVGDLSIARSVGRAAVLQLAATHSRSDLRIIAVIARSDSLRYQPAATTHDEWDWLRWLPHTRVSLDAPELRIAADRDASSEQVKELADLIAARSESTSSSSRGVPPSPEHLVVLEAGDQPVPSEIVTLLQQGPAVGVYFLVVHSSLAPDGCKAAVHLATNGQRGTLFEAGAAPRPDIIVDGIDRLRTEESARGLAALRPSRGEAVTAEPPRSVRLLELTGLVGATSDAIAERWVANRQGGADTWGRAVVGASAYEPFSLSLTADGPHLLCAGMTRMGKSEFLQTIIASLAAEHHPDDLRFLVIGFKGGADFGIARELPHTIDLVTNLDRRSFERAMRILDTEVKRRMALFERCGCANLEAYRALYLRGDANATRPVPRLLVVADEFAELRSTMPEQMAKLESLARTGGGLGVHMLLATQDPDGVVTGQIMSNVNARVCFKVASVSTSKSIIGSPLAGALPFSAKGRAFVGNAKSAATEVQMARIAGRHTGVIDHEPKLNLRPESFTSLSSSSIESGKSGEVPDQEKDFWVLKDLIVNVGADFDRGAIPWAPPLPTLLLDTDVSIPPSAAFAVAVGLADDPQGPARGLPIQRPHVVDLWDQRLRIAGAPGSGRTSALLMSAGAVARTYRPSEVHVLGLDFGGRGLQPLEVLPHTRGVLGSDYAMAARAVRALHTEALERIRLLDQLGFAHLRDQWEAQVVDRMPALLLLVDRIDALVGAARGDSGAALLIEALIPLIRDGSSAGVSIVATTEAGVALGALEGVFKSPSLLLKLSSAEEYRDYPGTRPIGLTADDLETWPNGRAVTAANGTFVQMAAIGGVSRQDQRAELERIAAAAIERDPHGTPPRFETLPDLITTDMVGPGDAPADFALPVIIAVDETRAPIWLDLAGSARKLVVAGPRKKGRTNALVQVLSQVAGLGVSVAICASRGRLLDVADLDQLVGRFTDPAQALDFAESWTGGRLVTLIDDADSLGDDVMTSGRIKALPRDVCLVLSATSDNFGGGSGAFTPLRNEADVLWLAPDNKFHVKTVSKVDTEEADQLLMPGAPAGRGLLVTDGSVVTPVQVPLGD